ncbi:MAG: bacterioferritin, partial [Paracoccus hibiscisoli]|uniref:ferritin-like domain-containing protein n=1 Tax=Paracoccus hibiscisoli TaxID=2023261 RepID=UPI00391A5D8B
TLDSDLAAEHDARTLYIEARDHCESVGDYVSKVLFEELIADEEGHIDFLETQLHLFDTIGEQNYGHLNAKPANEAE